MIGERWIYPANPTFGIRFPMAALTLYPYLLDRSCWVFDDERTGLQEEAFVLGATDVISAVVSLPGKLDLIAERMGESERP